MSGKHKPIAPRDDNADFAMVEERGDDGDIFHDHLTGCNLLLLKPYTGYFHLLSIR